MSLFLVLFAVAVIGAVAVLVVGRPRRTGGRWLPGRVAKLDGLAPAVENLPPVLLPPRPSPAEIDRVRFAVGLRGYRMDQVDEVLDVLRAELARKNEQVAALREHCGTEPPR